MAYFLNEHRRAELMRMDEGDMVASVVTVMLVLVMTIWVFGIVWLGMAFAR